MYLLSEGAEAKIYTQNILGNKLIFKVRGSKKYRSAPLDERIRKLRTKREAKIMLKAFKEGIAVPKLVAVSKFTICMEMIDGKLLKDTKVSLLSFSKSGTLLAKMHNSNISHGDFTPANIILSNGKPFAIDFGLSEITLSWEEKAMDLLLMKRAVSKTQFRYFLSGYAELQNARLALLKLKEIEKRGRYKIRTLTTS